MTETAGGPGNAGGRAGDAGDADARGGATEPDGQGRSRHTRWLYVRVIIVQAVALAALYLLQAMYGSG